MHLDDSTWSAEQMRLDGSSWPAEPMCLDDSTWPLGLGTLPVYMHV